MLIQVLFLNGKWTNLKVLLASLILISSLSADLVLKKTLACPSLLLLQKSVQEDMQDALRLEMYAIANNCVVLSKQDGVEAIGYDPLNSKDIYQKVLYKKTGVELYMLKSSLQVEQAGKKATYRF